MRGVAIICALMLACTTPPAPPSDGGVPDAGHEDAGTGDGGVDAGAVDAGLPDAGADTTPPDLRITVQTPSRPSLADVRYLDGFLRPNAWRVDEDPLVAVEWTATDVDAGSVVLEVVQLPDAGGSALNQAVSRATGCLCDGGCQCFKVDHAPLWPVRTGQFAESFDVELWLRARASDYSGNSTEVAGAMLESTRFVWEWHGNTVPLTVPALDPAGNLYLPTDDGFVSLDPWGEARWRWSDGGSGAQAIYFPLGDAGVVVFAQAQPDGGTAALRELRADNGSELFACPLPGALPNVTGPVALSTPGRSAAVVAASAGLASYVVALSFDRNGAACSTAAVTFTARPDVAPLGRGDLACFSGQDDQVHCVELADGGWSLPLSESTVDPSGGAVSPMATVDLAGVPKIVGFADMPELAVGGMFILDANAVVEERFLPMTGSRFGPVVLARGPSSQPMAIESHRYGGVVVTDLDAGTSLPVGASVDNNHVAAIAGADGLIHLRSELDQLSFGLTPNDAGYYEAQRPFDTTDIDIPGTIDCNRLTRRGGVFYAVTRERRVRALLVQSPGIDTTADWPKFLRDPANSGNATPNLLPLYTCP